MVYYKKYKQQSLHRKCIFVPAINFNKASQPALIWATYTVSSIEEDIKIRVSNNRDDNEDCEMRSFIVRTVHC